MEKFDLLTLGEVLLRLSPPASQRIMNSTTFDKHVGGAELNVAAGGALLGLNTGIISKLPDNGIGYFARNMIGFSGVKDDYLVYDAHKDSRLGLYYYEGGAHPIKPSIAYDRKNTAMGTISIEDFPKEMYESTRCFHISGITLALNRQTRATATTMIKRFKSAGALISFDVNFRGNLWSGEEAKSCIEEILPLIDIFFCSESTARLTFKRTGSLKEMMQGFCDDYPISIIISTMRTVHSPKRHSFTSLLFDSRSNQFYEEEPYIDIEVIDRIGSGDAFVAGALYGILTYENDLLKAVEYGNAVSALKNTVAGDLLISTLRETDEIIGSHKRTGLQKEMNR